MLHGQNSRLVFTSVSGHLMTYDFCNSYRNWQSCSPEQLFEAPIVKKCPDNFVKIKNTLEKEIRSCNSLVIWTDCDREGENIGFEIIDVCRAVKPNINVYRAKFSDMTLPSLSRAINNLIQPDERISQAVDVRSELDLRIGAAFTRFQTLRLQNTFPNVLNDKVISYGSCQIPTLGFVAQRYKEIQNFVCQTFWKIKLNHKINKVNVEFSWSRNRLFDKSCCEAFLMLCKADKEAVIQNVLQKPKNKWRPVAMDTIELEKTGSRKLKLTAKRTMEIAEKLYQQGYISYPRTETNKFSKEINLRSLVELQTQHPDWGEFANRVIDWGPNPRNGNKSDQAHPPIHPTKFVNSLQGDEKRVYELVVRHFLACVSKDAVGSETIVTATIGNEEFTASGLIVLERNYLDVYIYEKWNGKEIHHYEIGQRFTPTELALHEGSTNPPSLLTEADLIALMEKHGIGTDATHAEHINTIKERGYIGENNGYLLPGTLGMGLVEGYELMNLKLAEPKLRAGLEEDLKLICEGRKNPREVLAEQIVKYKECYQIIAREAQNLDRAISLRFNEAPREAANIPNNTIIELFKCPKCRKHSTTVKQKKDNSGGFISCLGYPECRHSIFLNDVKEITAVDEVCLNCRSTNKKVKLKFNQISMLGFMNENPNYSKIDRNYFISCLVCDENLRRVLKIPVENVKILGNIVAASAQPIHHGTNNWGNSRPPTNNPRPTPNPPRPNIPPNSRNFGSNSRGGWFSDDDDDRPMGGGGAISNGNNQPSNSRNNNVLSKLPNVKCQCDKTAAKFTCKKEGPNCGRPFYNCQSRTCKFFAWADEPLPRNVQIDTTSAATRRKCGVCKQEGHTKRNCPNLTGL
jgi:DNA topoisomerase III